MTPAAVPQRPGGQRRPDQAAAGHHHDRGVRTEPIGQWAGNQ
jgi:hypothetical protein